MKAWVLREYNHPLEMVEMETPKAEGDQILLRVKACGVCRSDLKILRGEIPPPLVVLPHVPGHEVAGEVAMVGDQVFGVQEGDVGLVYLYVPCRHCQWCLSGQENLCVHLRRIGFELQGGFAEFILVPSYSFCPFERGQPFHHMAILGDAVATSYRAITRLAEIKAGQVVLIVGVGGLGVHATQVARLCGARVFAADIDPEALRLAEEFGADVLLGAENHDVDKIKELTRGKGVDAVIEMVGSPDTLSWSLPALKKGGTLVIVGYAPDRPFPLDSMAMHYNEWSIKGARLSTKAELLEVIELVERGQIQPVVTKTYPFERANEALIDLADGTTIGRIALTFPQ
jgi:propanol-preferring alcohol dehydrogenase